MHRFLLHNREIRDTNDRTLTAGQVGLLNGWGVFSTLRIKHGVLFAWERHWERMKRDAKLMHIPFPEDPREIEPHLLRLVEANQAFDATLRLSIIRNTGGLFESPGLDRPWDLIAFTKDLLQGSDGVKLTITPFGRYASHRFQSAKIASWSFNLTFLEEAQSRGFDETILLNERGEVSECTSANLFAVFGSDVVTPPLSSGCLPGITREILLEAIRVPGLVLGERTLAPADLEKADQIFLTSSIREVRSIAIVEGLSIRNQSLAAARLRDAFHQYQDAYVRRKVTVSQSAV